MSTDSGETSRSVGHVTPFGHQEDIKKEELADEDDLCKSAGRVSVLSVDQEYAF